MFDRKFISEAIRIDNNDVLPKFGVASAREAMEAATEYINIDKVMDYEEGKLTRDGAIDILDMLNIGSVGISDSDGQPALSFMKSGDEIYAHNMFTDEDDIIDATIEAIIEYVGDQLDTRVFDPEESALEEQEESFNEEGLQNYAVVVAKDVGNDYDIIEFKEGFHSYEEAQRAAESIEENLDEDPMLVVCIIYSDGMSWFDAETGEEFDIELPEEFVDDTID